MRLKLALILTMLSMKMAIGQEFGPMIGLNSAYIKGTNESRKLDFHLGLFGQIESRDGIHYLTQLMYSRQGVKSGSLRANYNYLNLAFMPCYYPSDKFFLFAGPQVGYLLSAKITGGTRLVDLKDRLRHFDAALSAGAGISLDYLLITARYNYGLTNTEKPDANDTRIYSNQVIQLSVGFKIQ